MKKIVIEGEDINDITVGHSVDEGAMAFKMGTDVMMCMNDSFGVKFPTDVELSGNVTVLGLSGESTIKLGDTILTETQLKKLLALLQE